MTGENFANVMRQIDSRLHYHDNESHPSKFPGNGHWRNTIDRSQKFGRKTRKPGELQGRSHSNGGAEGARRTSTLISRKCDLFAP